LTVYLDIDICQHDPKQLV